MFLEDEDDIDDLEPEVSDEDSEDEGYLEEEETLEELDVDARGHVRPRSRRSRFEDEESEY